jgi:hypothetical protein
MVWERKNGQPRSAGTALGALMAFCLLAGCGPADQAPVSSPDAPAVPADPQAAGSLPAETPDADVAGGDATSTDPPEAESSAGRRRGSDDGSRLPKRAAGRPAARRTVASMEPVADERDARRTPIGGGRDRPDAEPVFAQPGRRTAEARFAGRSPLCGVLSAGSVRSERIGGGRCDGRRAVRRRCDGPAHRFVSNPAIADGQAGNRASAPDRDVDLAARGRDQSRGDRAADRQLWSVGAVRRCRC